MVFSCKNKKGVEFWLHSRGKLFFFSKNPEGAIDLPENLTVIEGPTGLPMVKKKG